LAGPTIGQLDNIVDIFQTIREGNNPFPKMANLIQGNTPFINLFYLRMALDYLILYNIQEWQNPGYLRRLERRMDRDFNQRFYIPPSRVIPRGGSANLPKIIQRMFEEVN